MSVSNLLCGGIDGLNSGVKRRAGNKRNNNAFQAGMLGDERGEDSEM